MLRFRFCEIPFSAASATCSWPLVLLAGLNSCSVLFLQEHYLHYSGGLFRHLQRLFHAGLLFAIIVCLDDLITITFVLADLWYVFPDVLQYLFYIVAYFDFWSPRAKLYLSSVARKSPSLQGHCQQRSYELVSVFQVDTFRYLKSQIYGVIHHSISSIYVIQGLWHSVVIFFGCILLWESDTPFDSRGLTMDFWSFGTLIYTGVIVVVSLKVCLRIP